MNTTPTTPTTPTGSAGSANPAGSTPPDAKTPTRVSLCGHCGRPHHTAPPTRRCACIPAEVWTEPEAARAIRTLDLGALIRLVRAHPRTRHLPQTALAAMTGLSQATVSRLESGAHANVGVHRCRQALTGLGAPPPQDDTPPPAPAPPPQVPAGVPCVVITSPVPLHVRVLDSPHGEAAPRSLGQGEVTFLSHTGGPRLLLDQGTTWGMTSTPDGTTAWFTLATTAHTNPQGPDDTTPPAQHTDT